MSRTITRKEIAAANDLSERSIRRREKQIGLDHCRDHTCNRPIRYKREEAARRLRARGFEVPEE
jgi:hypothetical protein